MLEKPGKIGKKAPPVVLRADRATRIALGFDTRGGQNGVNYSRELAAEICRRIALGESLKAICRDPGMPCHSTVIEWAVFDRDGFANPYAKARERQMEVWADQVIEVAQDREREPNCRRVEIDALKWITSKLNPRRFGDKLQVGGDADNPLRVLHEHVVVDRLSSVELAALEQFAQARLMARDVPHEDVVNGDIIENTAPQHE